MSPYVQRNPLRTDDVTCPLTHNFVRFVAVLRVSSKYVSVVIETGGEATASVTSCECGPPPVQTVYTSPPGLMVIVGQLPEPPPRPQKTKWLAVTVTVTGLSGVSVPDAGDTLTAPPGSLATAADQLTGPPEADREIWTPEPPTWTTSRYGRDAVPPGDADIVPVGVGVGLDDREGVAEGDALVGGELVLADGDALVLAGAGLVLCGVGFDVVGAGVVGAALREAPAVADAADDARTALAGGFPSASGVKC